jgi:hypothetical protein
MGVERRRMRCMLLFEMIFFLDILVQRICHFKLWYYGQMHSKCNTMIMISMGAEEVFE